jgi:peroxiredoxin
MEIPMANEQLKPRTSPVSAGEPAPDFMLLDQNRQESKLSEAVKKGDVVLCFFPLAFTGVCGTEMKCVNDEMARWAAKGAQVVGVSCDSFAVLKAWAEQMGLKQTLLADMHRAVCRAYGFYWPELNVSTRGTVVIGKAATGQGVVKWVQAREIKTAMKWEEVLAAIA